VLDFYRNGRTEQKDEREGSRDIMNATAAPTA
jgi:hypothetical protein